MKDMIYRQTAIDALDEFIQWCDKALRSPLITSVDAYAVKVEKASLEHYREVLESLQSAHPERRKGKWIEGKCNRCGERAPYWSMASTYYKSNFCPHCGADMRGKRDD